MKRSNLDIYNDMGNLNLDGDNSPLLNKSSGNMTKSKKKVKASDFYKIKELGNGKYGRVYLVRYDNFYILDKKAAGLCAL